MKDATPKVKSASCDFYIHFLPQVKLLEEEIAELEALEDVHEQLIEEAHEQTHDLREEIDMAQAAKREVLSNSFYLICL